MKKLRLFWRNIPRKRKIAINLFASFLLVFWIYLLAGSPASAETKFRRLEKAHLVGPGTILANLKIPGTGYDSIILADTQEGVTVFSYDWDDQSRTQLVYREKSQGIAILSIPGDSYSGIAGVKTVPIFLFDGYVNAVYAELALDISPSESPRILHAQREKAGFFHFQIDTAKFSSEERHILAQLQTLSGNTMAGTKQTSISATVKFYDENNSLIAEIPSAILPT